MVTMNNLVFGSYPDQFLWIMGVCQGLRNGRGVYCHPSPPRGREGGGNTVNTPSPIPRPTRVFLACRKDEKKWFHPGMSYRKNRRNNMFRKGKVKYYRTMVDHVVRAIQDEIKDADLYRLTLSDAPYYASCGLRTI